MPKVNIYNGEGKIVGEKELNAKVFGVAVKPTFIHEILVGLMANRRQPLAHTKTRGEVRGGGKKPWKQKGTGRARQGSTRAPQWKHGGIVFGPRSDRDYTKKINRKQKQLATAMILSDKVANEKLLMVEDFPVKNGKTKEMVGLLSKLPLSGKVMVLIADRSPLVSRAVRNVPSVHYARTTDMNLVDVVNADYVVANAASLVQLEERYTSVK